MLELHELRFCIAVQGPHSSLPQGCRWDWDGTACREQRPAQDPFCLSFLPLFFMKSSTFLSYITTPHGHRAQEGFRGAI